MEPRLNSENHLTNNTRVLQVETSRFGADHRDWRLLGGKRMSQMPKERTKDLLKRRAAFKNEMGYPETPPDDSLTPPNNPPTSPDVLQQRYNPEF